MWGHKETWGMPCWWWRKRLKWRTCQPSLPTNHQKLGRGQEEISYRFWREHSPAHPFISEFWPPELRGNRFRVFKATLFEGLFYGNLRKWIQHLSFCFFPQGWKQWLSNFSKHLSTQKFISFSKQPCGIGWTVYLLYVYNFFLNEKIKVL